MVFSQIVPHKIIFYLVYSLYLDMVYVYVCSSIILVVVVSSSSSRRTTTAYIYIELK